MRGRLGDHWSLLRPFHEIFGCDVDQDLQDYLRHLFDAARARTATLRYVTSSQVETDGKTSRQSAPSINLSLDQERWSSAAVSHLGSATSNQVGPKGPSYAQF